RNLSEVRHDRARRRRDDPYARARVESRSAVTRSSSTMTRTIGIGVIGMGWMGLVHGRSYQAIADRFPESGIRPRLVGCADEVEARAREAQERLGFEEYATDWKKVISRPDVEVVNIASPNHLHLEMVRAAAREHKHIFCEKPVGRDSTETRAIAEL